MKRFVNGQEVELAAEAGAVKRLSDRLMVSTKDGAFSAVAIRQGDRVLVSYRGHQYTVERTKARVKGGGTAGSGELRAPMPGLIVDVLATQGDKVVTGDKILVLEAMKTQQAFVAPFNGTVARLGVTKGQQVAEGDIMAVVEADEPGEQ